MPSALLPAGTTRYASAYSMVGLSITAADGWADLPGMTKFIAIPSGKTADVIVSFCGAAATNQPSLVHTRALIRDAVAAPADFWLTGSTTISSHCASFSKSNVTSGSPPVKIQWSVDGAPANSAFMYGRHMIVIVNIH
jgi:hypothetical protein